MNIYFVAAISQLDKYRPYYQRIVDVLQKKGHKVQYEHILSSTMEKVYSLDDNQKIAYYRKFLRWINQADIVIAEASFPSTVNIGHEISVALEKSKPVVVLYQKSKSPIFIEGIQSDKLIVEEYTANDLERVVAETIDYASDQQDTRFNFFISPAIGNYLDWISRKKKLPRAVYLRQLIENDMMNNK